MRIGHEPRGGAAVKHFAGPDVSLDETAVCVVDEAGATLWEGPGLGLSAR